MLEALPSTRQCDTPVSTVAISKETSRFLWAGGYPGEDCSISVCDAASDKVLHTLSGHECPVVRARFLSDGSTVSFSFDSHICRWTATGELAMSNNISLTHRADGFAVSNDETFAVVGDYRGEIAGYRLDDGKQSFTFKENNDGHQVWSLALSPDNETLLSGNADGVISAWDLTKQSRAFEVNLGWGHHVQGLAWHPGGDIFAAAIAPDGAASEESRSHLSLIAAKKGEEVGVLDSCGHQPFCCSFSPNGRYVAAAGGGTDADALGNQSETDCVIHIWDVESRGKVARLSGHDGLVRDLAFTPDSQWLLSAGWDNTVRAWDLAPHLR